MASTPRGFYEQPIDVAVRSSTPGATLVYTTDGSVPSLSHGTVVPPAAAGESPAFTLRVDRTTTLRVRAFKDDFIPSRTGTFTYLFVADIAAQECQGDSDAGFPSKWQHRRSGLRNGPRRRSGPKISIRANLPDRWTPH